MKKIIFLFVFTINLLFSQSYHDTQGKLEITNNGNSSFSLPIALPASINNVGPSITVNYYSGLSGGICGQGWSLQGISSIVRISARKDIDGFTDTVDFDLNDKLAFEGQRLLIKTGTYLNAGSTYQTEIQSNYKIEQFGSGASIYFVVTASDGSKTWYGNYGGSNGTDISSWNIVRFEDTNGNFITYHYTRPLNKSLCLSEINFSSNIYSNTSPNNKILFTYVQKNRIEKAYLKGELIERPELLHNIKVYTKDSSLNSLLFREYVLEYITDPQLGYQRINKITEKNGAGESANPILFEYDSTVTQSQNSEVEATYLNPFSFNNVDSSGDFDGDGFLDFITDDKLFVKVFNSTPQHNGYNLPFLTDKNLPNYKYNNTFTINTLKNNKYLSNQYLLNVYATNDTTTEFKVYGFQDGVFSNVLSKSISLDLSLTYNIVNSTGTVYGIQCWNWLQINAASVANAQKYKPTFYEGDFNGDTISEILIKKPSNSITITNNLPTDPITLSNPPFNSELCNFSITRGAETYYLVNLDPNTGSTLGTTGFKSISDTFNCLNNITLLADFNGDNKSDILSIRPDKSYVICEIIQTNNYGYTSIIAQGSIPLYSTDRLLLTGDFNGDGKTDLIFSNMVGSGCEDQSYCNDWTIYFCNPKLNFGEAFEASQYDIVHYMPVRNYSLSTITNSYYVMDTNKDGKSDIVRIERVFYKPLWTINNHDTRWTVSSYVNNIGNQLNNGFQMDYHSPTNHDYDNNWFPIPIVSNFRNKGLSYDLVMVQEQNNSLTFIKFTKDFTRDNLLSKVIQSNGGIVDEIFYSQMQPNLTGPDNGVGTDFYSSTNTLQNPYVEVSRNPFSRLVFRLKNTAVGFTRYQDFKYRGYVIKIDGVGSLGFTKTARSAWYNEQNSSKTWYVTENNPQLRGATIRQTTFQLPSTIELDLSNIPTTNLISKVENTYVESAAGVFPYSILLNTQTTTDYLSGVIKKTEYLEYTPDYLLPRQVKSSNYLGTVLHGESLQIVDFESNVNNGTYFVGRPTQKSITNKVYVNTLTGSVDTKSSIEKYFYDTKGNITKIETTKNTDPTVLINENNYYPNGLLWKTRIKNSGFTPLTWDTSNGIRETVYTYDASNRFIKTEQNPLGILKTNNNFHPIYGLVLSSTNSTLNLTETNEYDNWGKLIKSTTAAGVSTISSYSRSNNIFTTTNTIQNNASITDGSESITEQNVLAQIIRKGQKDINGNWIYVKSEYDYLGRLYRSSEPYFGTSSPSKWNYTYYDDFSRPISKVSNTNRVINMSYNGLTATSIDVTLGLTKTKTTNANGVVITAVDNPGGTIISKYDANGNLVESLYEGISTKIIYDSWGRKISLDDPSSDSLYEYKYNAYGELIYEKSPKGETKLIMSPVGLLNQKIETGDNTNITSTYSYDPINKLLNSTSIINSNVSTNPSVYTNFYDSLKRIYKTVESLQLPGNVSSTFTNELTFDSFSRVNSEKNTTVIHNQTSVKNISFTYQNGYKKQVKDGNLILWEVNSTDENLNLLSANLGNGIQLTNTFDQFGYLEENKLQSSNINISNRTNFEPILGNLTTRYSGFFNLNDNFTYDNLDRLSSWEESGINTLKFNFNSSLEGFVPVGNAILVLENNPQNVLDKRLKVTTSALNTGVYKTIISQGIAQQKFRISGYFSFVNGNSEIKLKLIESNQTGVVNEIDIPLEQNSIFNFDYTLQSNSEVHLYFTQGNLNVLSPFIENPSNIFLLDNLEVSEYELYSQTYDSKGRIQSNASANYSYSASKPYRNISIYGENFLKGAPSNVYQTNVTYNANRQPVTITNSIENVNLYYNGYGQRCAMIWGNANVDPLTRNQRRYYSADGNVEVNTFYATGATTPNKVEIITYLDGSAYTAIALNKTIVDLNINTTTNDIYYLHRDYQGTINAITNANGAIVERRLFDVWGHLKRVEDGNGNTLSKLTFIERGYTGHEHLSSSELINMNARLYSPLYHRFLSPDLVIQDPFNTQNYNRYSYCVNNPTKYTDITGNVFGVDDAILIAVAVAAVTYTLNAAMNDIPFTYQGLVTNMAISAFSAAVTFGIGEVASQIGNFWVRSSFQAFAHGSFRGTMTGIQGGNFWASFSAAAISSIASSAWSGGYTFDSQGAVTEVFYHPGIKDILGLNGTFFSHAFATVSGGFSSKLAKGNFWQGAVIAFSVSMFNHYFHNEGDNDEHKVQYAKYDSDKNAEKLIYFKKSGRDRDLFKSAKSEELIAGVLTIYGHGNVQSFNYSGLNVDYVKNLFYKDSFMYRRFRDNYGKINNSLIMVWKSCNIGNYSEGGLTSMAQLMTEDNYGLTVYGAANFWLISGKILDNAGYYKFFNNKKVGWVSSYK